MSLLLTIDIYYCIVINIIQIPTLVTLGLIAKVSSSDVLDVIKYKVCICDSIEWLNNIVLFVCDMWL